MGLRHVRCDAWAGAKEYFAKTQSDLVAVQEPREPEVECKDAEQAARKSGWRTVITPCTVTAVDGKSVGVAISGRTRIVMKHSVCLEAWPKLLNGKFILKHLAAVCKGGLHAGSCYLTSCNAGSKDQWNVDTLQLMAGVLNCVKGPWAVGGDWNCTPEELHQAGWLKLVVGVIVVPEVPTCGERIIAFFMVGDCLRHAAPVACTAGDGGFYFLSTQAGLSGSILCWVKQNGKADHKDESEGGGCQAAGSPARVRGNPASWPAGQTGPRR